MSSSCWQGVQALASSRVMWLAGWLLASCRRFGVGLQPALPAPRVPAGWCWQLVEKGPDSAQLALVRWHSHGSVALLLGSPGPGTAAVACTQPKGGFSRRPGCVGGTVCWAGCPGKVPPLQMSSPPPSLGCQLATLSLGVGAHA